MDIREHHHWPRLRACDCGVETYNYNVECYTLRTHSVDNEIVPWVTVKLALLNESQRYGSRLGDIVGALLFPSSSLAIPESEKNTATETLTFTVTAAHLGQLKLFLQVSFLAEFYESCSGTESFCKESTGASSSSFFFSYTIPGELLHWNCVHLTKLRISLIPLWSESSIPHSSHRYRTPSPRSTTRTSTRTLTRTNIRGKGFIHGTRVEPLNLFSH